MLDEDALKITEIIISKFNLKFDSDNFVDLSIEDRNKIAKSLVDFTFSVYDSVLKKMSEDHS